MYVSKDSKGRWEYLDKPFKVRHRNVNNEALNKKVRVTFRITDKECLMLDDICQKTGMNRSDVVREALHSLDFDLRRFS